MPLCPKKSKSKKRVRILLVLVITHTNNFQSYFKQIYTVLYNNLSAVVNKYFKLCSIIFLYILSINN